MMTYSIEVRVGGALLSIEGDAGKPVSVEPLGNAGKLGRQRMLHSPYVISGGAHSASSFFALLAYQSMHHVMSRSRAGDHTRA
jgi:hypothetical protein